MGKLQYRRIMHRGGWLLGWFFCLTTAVLAQSTTTAPKDESPSTPQTQSAGQAEHRISPDQARQLFSLVDDLLKFSSQETGLPIKSAVKRQMISRAGVESFLKTKFEEDDSAKRLQRGEIVLKKFGLLDRDFSLKPFLLALLKEQIEAYYDSKSKTVYLLDWVSVDDQKPVLAHELTHALQDQHADLEKWSDQTPIGVSGNSAQDSDHILRDEMDTAREAVVEGQASAVMMDYVLQPLGKSMIKNPEVMDYLDQQMGTAENSPVLSRAPLLLSESMLFPYRDGLGFEQDLWMDEGQTMAFAGTMDRPPTSTWEIVNPREYERHSIPAVPLLPNIHPLVDKLYKPYDIGQVGLLDLRILAKLFGGDSVARNLASAWNGGLYWAGQLRSARTPVQQDSTASISLFYLSAWKNSAGAASFAQLYADSLGRKYSGLKQLPENSPNAAGQDEERIFTSDEGPILIVTRGKLVFIAESFDLPLARKLASLLLDAQGTGELQQTRTEPAIPALPYETVPGTSLTGGLVRFFSESGVMKAAVHAATSSALRP
jgi:hypothetical protein